MSFKDTHYSLKQPVTLPFRSISIDSVTESSTEVRYLW